jgi:hypothetical protein
MGKYLQEAPHAEAMNHFGNHEMARALTHRVWTHDFMALADHDVACPVCFNAHAMLTRDVTPGQYSQRFGPCIDCTAAGWEIRQLPRWRIGLRKLWSFLHG